MDGKKALLSRRSCRKYLQKDVPKEVVEDILLAGRSASTGMNRQELRFYVIFNNVKLLNEIGLKCLNGLKNKEWFEGRKKEYDLVDPIFYDAPCAIVLTALKENGKSAMHFAMDAGIATGNMQTMITYHGLSCVPVGIAKFGDEEAVLKGIGTDKEKEELLLVLPFGYEHPDWKAKFLTDKPLTSYFNWVK